MTSIGTEQNRIGKVRASNEASKSPFQSYNSDSTKTIFENDFAKQVSEWQRRLDSQRSLSSFSCEAHDLWKW
jgi:hypothetical protein